MAFSEHIYRLSHRFAKSVIQQLILGDVEGLSNVPSSGPCILAVNHASHLDPPLLGTQFDRIVTFFARKTLWVGGPFSWWLNAVGTIPVDRDGDSDITAMKRTLQTLKKGGLLTLFPEGTRSKNGKLQKAKPGIGLIAAKSQVVVIPCRIFNSFHVLSKDSFLPNLNVSIHIRYGEPISPDVYDPGREAGKERYQIVADRIMEAISKIERPRPKVI